MKKKIFIIMFLLVGLVLSVSLTYSVFNDKTKLASKNHSFAKFIFNTEIKDEIDIALTDLKPGTTKEYTFSVSNSKDSDKSNISIEYIITLNTYHFIPLSIKLYSLNNGEELLMDCNEESSRNSTNKLECSIDKKELSHLNNKEDKYKLVIYFDENYNSYEYSNLVDYINLSIKSWQKIVNN